MGKDDRPIAAEVRDDGRDQEAETDTQDTTDATQYQSLGQKLRHDVAPPGAECTADADLTRSFGHGREHHVHDANAADEK